MHGRLRPILEGERISKTSKSWKTNSFGRSIMGNQHCNGRCNHLGLAASFVQTQRLPYKLVDRLHTFIKNTYTTSTFIFWIIGTKIFRIVGTRWAKENLFVIYIYLKTILGGSCPEASSPPSAVPETSTWQSDTMMAPSGRASWNTNVVFYHYLQCVKSWHA